VARIASNDERKTIPFAHPFLSPPGVIAPRAMKRRPRGWKFRSCSYDLLTLSTTFFCPFPVTLVATRMAPSTPSRKAAKASPLQAKLISPAKDRYLLKKYQNSISKSSVSGLKSPPSNFALKLSTGATRIPQSPGGTTFGSTFVPFPNIPIPPPSPAQARSKVHTVEYLQQIVVGHTHDQNSFYPPGATHLRPLPPVEIVSQQTLHREFFFSMAGVPGFDCVKHGELRCIKRDGDKIWLPYTDEAMNHLGLFAGCFYVMQQYEKVEATEDPQKKLWLTSEQLGEYESRKYSNYKSLEAFVKRDFHILSVYNFLTSVGFQVAKNLC